MSFTADISKSVRREVYGLKNVPKDSAGME